MRLLRPQDRIVFTFAGDADLPLEQRPRLIAKVMSVGDVQALQGITRGVNGIESLVDAMLLAVTSWENVNDPTSGEPIPFNRESVAKWLTIEEITEVIEFVTGRLSADDRKKSEPQHSSAVASCAAVAPVDVLAL
jgi:hypothetical protein